MSENLPDIDTYMVDGESMECSRVGDMFKVENIPLLSETVAHLDIFEADQNGEELVIRRVVHRANRRKYDFVLPESAIGSKQLEELTNRIELLDGYWERVCDGLLLISMPADSPYNPTSDVMAMAEACRSPKHRLSRRLMSLQRTVVVRRILSLVPASRQLLTRYRIKLAGDKLEHRNRLD
jgi:hypothetical protein